MLGKVIKGASVLRQLQASAEWWQDYPYEIEFTVEKTLRPPASTQTPNKGAGKGKAGKAGKAG